MDGVKCTCIALHPGFRSIVLDPWALAVAYKNFAVQFGCGGLPGAQNRLNLIWNTQFQPVSLPTGQPQVLALKCKNWTICARSIELPHQCPKCQTESSLHQHHRTICWEIMSAEKLSQSDQSPAGRICIPHPTPSGVHGRFDKIVVQNTNYIGIWCEKVPAGNRHHFMQLGNTVQGEPSLCSQGICAQHKLSLSCSSTFCAVRGRCLPSLSTSFDDIKAMHCIVDSIIGEPYGDNTRVLQGELLFKDTLNVLNNHYS